MKPDERALLEHLLAVTREHKARGEFAHMRRFVEAYPINQKRAWYLLGKWYDKGWFDCGVSLGAGWFNEDALPHDVRAPEIA
jgi:hypothetical protein